MNQQEILPVVPAPVHSIPSSSAGWPFVPRLRIYSERVTLDSGDSLRVKLSDATRTVASLVFDYGDGELYRASEPENVHAGDDDDAVETSDFPDSVSAFVDRRNSRAEARAQCMLESFGAVELARLDDVLVAPTSRADYLVHQDDSVHALCSFLAHAVPLLRERGFDVEIDEHQPRVTKPAASFYAALRGDDGDDAGDWFSLELGVDVDGERIDLLPALLDLLRSVPDDSSLAALRRLPAKYRVLRVEDGRYLPFSPDRLIALLEVLIDLYDGAPSPEASGRFRKERALCLTGLDDVLGSERPMRWDGGSETVERARKFLREPRKAPPPAHGLAVTLRPYQEEGLAWLQHLRENEMGGVLADDMGLGKTLQTIAHLVVEKRSGRMNIPSLVVMPTSLIGNWQRELRKFAPGLLTLVLHGRDRNRHSRYVARADVVLTTYPVLLRDIESLKEAAFHLVVLDEAQAIKNPRSRAHQAAAELNARHRLCLTGTPVENNLDELWALFDFLAKGMLGTGAEFRARFRLPIERRGDEQQLSLLRERVAPFVLRRMKEDVAKELPPRRSSFGPSRCRARNASFTRTSASRPTPKSAD